MSLGNGNSCFPVEVFEQFCGLHSGIVDSGGLEEDVVDCCEGNRKSFMCTNDC